MKNLWTSILIAVVLALAVFFVLRFLWPSDGEVDRLKAQLNRTRAQVDSLQQVNRQIMAEVDSIEVKNQNLAQEIGRLNQNIDYHKKKLNETLRSIHEYQGSPDDLQRELNRIIRTPMPQIPN
jgi:methyl-accepting chemotaxis protein